MNPPIRRLFPISQIDLSASLAQYIPQLLSLVKGQF